MLSILCLDLVRAPFLDSSSVDRLGDYTPGNEDASFRRQRQLFSNISDQPMYARDLHWLITVIIVKTRGTSHNTTYSEYYGTVNV